MTHEGNKLSTIKFISAGKKKKGTTRYVSNIVAD